MQKSSWIYAVVIFGTASLLNTVMAIELIKERDCFDVRKTVPVDANWVASQKSWYYPIMSRPELYSFSAELSGKRPEDLREDEIYYRSCFRMESVDDKFLVHAFGKTKSFSFREVRGLEVYDFLQSNGDILETCYTTYTDNRTFIQSACCYKGTQMTWGIQSTVKDIPENTRTRIYDHAETLGFRRKYFTGLEYDSCGKYSNSQDRNHFTTTFLLLNFVVLSQM